ncbi:MAG: Rieske 2Fe-2S domain-containing protein [Anaerolineae bacterium]|nr:Rieske 2Fe-2S domain-containing protein [Anaerolineae bacterium]
MNGLLQSILETGTYFVVSDFKGQRAITAKLQECVLNATTEIVGSAARADLERRGLQYLHAHLPPEAITQVRDQVMPIMRPDLFRFTCEVGEGLLGLDREFFVDDYTILRINYPYEVGLKASDKAENPGIGRTDPQTKKMANSTQKRDERYDPKSYHKHTPPASWAHGPHKDTWTGHSRHGINLWWAMNDVVEENSMIFYPATFGKAYQADPRSLYLAAGYRLPKPNKMALHAGELLIFNPELLHATHLNTSGLTRMALSSRINPTEPKFDPACFYAREFWHSSEDIKQGKMEVIRQFKREENFEDPSIHHAETPVACVDYTAIPTAAASDGWESLSLETLDLTLDRQLIELSSGKQVILFRDGESWAAVQSTCPHLDTDLMDGYCGAGKVYCPAHGVVYNLASGQSASPLLRLQTYDLQFEPTTLRLRARA